MAGLAWRVRSSAHTHHETAGHSLRLRLFGRRLGASDNAHRLEGGEAGVRRGERVSGGGRASRGHIAAGVSRLALRAMRANQ